MATESDHRQKAEHNQRFLATIDAKEFPDWKVTVSFYRAIHLVEMVFARNGNHSQHHRGRHDELKRTYPSIWRHYRPLYEQARNARYKARPISQQTVHYVAGRLAAVEQEVATLIGVT